MALAFTAEQMADIRSSLRDSARRHAISVGLKKTSLDMLTADAGISKSSFYKFYESKEMLFLEVSMEWETSILSAAATALCLAKMLDAAKEKGAKTLQDLDQVLAGETIGDSYHIILLCKSQKGIHQDISFYIFLFCIFQFVT